MAANVKTRRHSVAVMSKDYLGGGSSSPNLLRARQDFEVDGASERLKRQTPESKNSAGNQPRGAGSMAPPPLPSPLTHLPTPAASAAPPRQRRSSVAVHPGAGVLSVMQDSKRKSHHGVERASSARDRRAAEPAPLKNASDMIDYYIEDDFKRRSQPKPVPCGSSLHDMIIREQTILEED